MTRLTFPSQDTLRQLTCLALFLSASVAAHPDDAMTAITSRYYSNALSEQENIWPEHTLDANVLHRDLQLFVYTQHYTTPSPASDEITPNEFWLISGVGLRWSDWLSFRSQLIQHPSMLSNPTLGLASVWQPDTNLSIQAAYGAPITDQQLFTLGASYRF